MLTEKKLIEFYDENQIVSICEILSFWFDLFRPIALRIKLNFQQKALFKNIQLTEFQNDPDEVSALNEELKI